jgi:hypothetical protein
MPVTTATQEERTMPQTVNMQIEYRGGEKHLHLKQNTVINFSKTGGQVTWNVEILPSAQTIPQAKEVRVWFPLPNLPFLNSPSVLSFSPIVYGADGIGRASMLLTPDPAFPLADGKETVIPLGIYTDIDDGQDAVPTGPNKRKNKFHQPGLQMVDGAHSHPECNVGP